MKFRSARSKLTPKKGSRRPALDGGTYFSAQKQPLPLNRGWVPLDDPRWRGQTEPQEP